MELYRRINPETGMWIEDVILDTPPLLEDGTPDPAYIAEPVPPGFWWSRWNGAAWVEGGTPPPTPEPLPPTPEALRMDQIEAALMELAGMIAGGV